LNGTTGEAFSYANDANGNVTSRTYPDGRVTSYTYDDDNRMTTATFNELAASKDIIGGLGGLGWSVVLDPANPIPTPSSGPPKTFTPFASSGGSVRFVNPKPVTGYTSIAIPQISVSTGVFPAAVTMQLFNGTVAGPVLTVTKTGTGSTVALSAPVTATTQFTSIVITNLGVNSVSIGKGVVLSEPAKSVTANYSYDVAGNVVSYSLPSGIAKTTTYDAASRVSKIEYKNAGTSLSSWTYSRDANGNPTQIIGTGTAEAARKFTYDAANRLTGFCQVVTVPCPTTQSQTFAYDAVGRRTTYSIGPVGQVQTYQYDAADQMTSSQVNTQPVVTYAYDANGSMTASGSTVFGYNSAKQLVSGANFTAFTYDGYGNRVKALGISNSGSSWTWDNNNALAVVVQENDNYGSLPTSFTYGLGPIGMQSGSDVYSSQMRFVLTDELGSMSGSFDARGNHQLAATYGPYGSSVGGTQFDKNVSGPRFGYTGEFNDAGSAGVYLRARRYIPSLGIFTQTDPLQADVGNAYPSPYVYANDNPMMYVDPSGLRAKRADGGVPSELALAFATPNPIVSGGPCNGKSRVGPGYVYSEEFGSCWATPPGFTPAVSGRNIVDIPNKYCGGARCDVRPSTLDAVLAGNPVKSIPKGTDVSAQAVTRKLTNVVGAINTLSAAGVGRACGRGVTCYDFSPGAVPDGADALTLGARIFCVAKCQGALLEHELVHVEQYRRTGYFGLDYLAQSVYAGSGCENSWEREAYEKNQPCAKP
jgi:RHS repeat-associated protein